MLLRPDELVSTTTCRAAAGAELASGERLAASGVAERVGYAIALTKELGLPMLLGHYNREDIAVLAQGLGPDGRKLPGKGYMAGRRLGWSCSAPKGLYCPDRFYRTVEEQVVRRLRQAAWVSAVVAGICATWPSDPEERSSGEWEALWAAVPDGTDKATLRNRTRQVSSYLERTGKLPSCLCDMEPGVSFGPTLALAAADRQMVELARTGGRAAVLLVVLPRVARPASRKDWSWVAIPITLPEYLPPGAVLKTPTLRVVKGRARVDLPWVATVPKLDRRKLHNIALGYDWGVNTFITTSIGYFDQTTGHVHTDGKPMRFDATGIAAKIERLRHEREQLTAKARQVEKLLSGLGQADPRRQALQKRLEAHKEEVARVSARQKHLGHSLAWAGARWLVDQAVANHASIIYAEDLKDLEAGGTGKKDNARVSASVRGELVDALCHLAKKAGIAVCTVPARGTSAQCPRCLRKLHHCPAPDRTTETGHSWAYCRHCHFSADRDHAASERIVSRGLAGQAHAFFNRSAGHMECRKAVDVKARRSLRPQAKRSAAPEQPHPNRVRYARPALATVHKQHQRPVRGRPTGQLSGSETTAVTVLEAQRRRATRHLRASGRGFHRHVRATLVSPRPSWDVRETTPRALTKMGDLPYLA